MTARELLGEWLRRHNDEWNAAGRGVTAKRYATVVAENRAGDRKTLSSDGLLLHANPAKNREARSRIREQIDAIVAGK